MTLSLPSVESWQPWALADVARDLRSVDEQFQGELKRMRSVVTDAQDEWTGAAYDAAYDRVGDEYTAAMRVSDEVTRLADAIGSAAASMQSARDVALRFVADARAEDCTVGDDWRVHGSDVDVAAIHQGLIDRAVAALVDEDERIAALLSEVLGDLRQQGDRVGMGSGAATVPVSEATERGNRDGYTLAAAVDGDGDESDLADVAAHLPESGLSAADLQRLAEGGSISTLPQDVQDYYKEFYRSAGSDGVFALADYLKEQELAGDPAAGARLDSMANGLVAISNEQIGTGLADDGSLTSPGSYQNVPTDFQEIIESRISEGDIPSVAGVMDTDPDYVSDLARLGDLLQESDPNLAPGTELGTELYQKAAHMVENDVAAMRFSESEEFARHDWAAGNFADVAGRNNEAAYRIWSGDKMPDGYEPEATVRALTGHDWSASDGGRGAASLIDWISEDTTRYPGDPIGDRARVALTELPKMLAPVELAPGMNLNGDLVFVEEDGKPIFETQRDAFVRSPELSTAVAGVLAGNVGSWAPSGGEFTEYSGGSRVEASGKPILDGFDAEHLLELGSYSDAGRLTLSAMAEKHLADDVAAAFASDPGGNLADELNRSSSPQVAARVEEAGFTATTRLVELDVIDHNAQQSLLQFAREGGASIAGELAGAGAIGALNPADEVVKKAVELSVKSAAEATLGEVLPELDIREAPDPNENRLGARANERIIDTILREADAAGQLPEKLRDATTGGVLSATYIQTDESAARELSKFFFDRGLDTFSEKHRQNYERRVGDDDGN